MNTDEKNRQMSSVFIRVHPWFSSRLFVLHGKLGVVAFQHCEAAMFVPMLFVRRVFWLLPCLGIVASIAGCGSGLVRVEGNVTFDGKPLESGAISFEPVDGRGPVAGGKIDCGAYVVGNCTPGKKTVTIVGTRKTGRRVKPGGMLPPDFEVDETEPLECKPQSAEIVAGKRNSLSFDVHPTKSSPQEQK